MEFGVVIWHFREELGTWEEAGGGSCGNSSCQILSPFWKPPTPFPSTAIFWQNKWHMTEETNRLIQKKVKNIFTQLPLAFSLPPITGCNMCLFGMTSLALVAGGRIGSSV